MQMTKELLNELIKAFIPAAPTVGAGAAFIVGRLGPCQLDRDKLKRYKGFIDWVGNAESKMRLLGITTSEQKASFVKEAKYSSETIKRVKQDTSSSSIWPGVSSNSKTSHVRSSQWVRLA